MKEEKEKLKDLMDIIKWSYEHKETWQNLCNSTDEGISTTEFGDLLSEVKHYGFMELYYFLLNKYGRITEISITNPNFPEFIHSCASVDFDIDLTEVHNIEVK